VGERAELLEEADADPAGDAVVEALSRGEVAELEEVGFEGDGVADADAAQDLVGGEAEVDEEVGELEGGLAVLGGLDVDGLAAVEGAEEVAVAGLDADAAREEVAGVKAAEGLEAEEAALVDVADVEGDLVHVAGEHQARGLRGGGVDPGEEVAHGVGLDAVAEAVDLGAEEVADALLASRGAGGAGEAL
jgi:hypothetical protein